jgi:hypothetical protein
MTFLPTGLSVDLSQLVDRLRSPLRGHSIYFGALFLSKTLSSRSSVPESKSGHTSILRPLDSTTRKALAPRASLLPFVPANATATSRLSCFAWMCPKLCLFNCRCRVLGGKPCLRQNSMSRNPLASNSIASRSTSFRLLRLRIWTSCFSVHMSIHQKLDAPRRGITRRFAWEIRSLNSKIWLLTRRLICCACADVK